MEFLPGLDLADGDRLLGDRAGLHLHELQAVFLLPVPREGVEDRKRRDQHDEDDEDPEELAHVDLSRRPFPETKSAPLR